MKNNNKPLVSICCITYNHENYIRDAIEGFLMQKTTFPIEILIHDDASTDKTADIIREYEKKHPDIIKPIYQKENQYSKGVKINQEFNFPRAQGKYIALCEGDDYWTDPLKLQKQVDFMEENKDCSMCFHRSKIELFNNHKNIVKNQKLGEYSKNHNQTFFPKNKFFYEGGSSAPTASMIFKSKYIQSLPEWYFNSPVGDTPLKLILSQKGKIGFLNDVMAIRRIGLPGSWNDRVRDGKEEEIKYLNGMIKMLIKFNKHSSGKYFRDVFRQMVKYDRSRILFGEKNSILDDISFDFKKTNSKQRLLIKTVKSYPDIYRIKYLNKLLLILLT